MQFWAKVKPKQSSPKVSMKGGEVSLRETGRNFAQENIKMLNLLLHLLFERNIQSESSLSQRQKGVSFMMIVDELDGVPRPVGL
ncbi:hypothetical protein TNCV_553811 [Trichonephila clavipes]|nr:hypothetical protein TNCV_553811 [Trichonephila clavipes]